MEPSELRQRTIPTDASVRVSREGDPGTGVRRSRVYDDLKLDRGSLRLVRIAFASDDDEPLICALEVVHFRDKPRYEALSFMWRPDEPAEYVKINQTWVPVGRDLFGALRFLRARARTKGERNFSKHIWIDAICINQTDTVERSEQARILAKIYSRAEKVVVWLGRKYVTHERRLQCASSFSMAGLDADRSLIASLRNDDYWCRAWTLQEISQAKSLSVCFGPSQEWPWDELINFVAWGQRMRSITFLDMLWIVLVNLLVGNWFADRTRGPLKLDKLRKSRYTASTTLRHLLLERFESEATDPRDKIYALVGLATDAVGFPIDYHKSLFEVWKDTMICLNNSRGVLDRREAIPLGRLVKRILMGDISRPLNEVLGDTRMTRLIRHDDRSPRADIFKVHGSILGMVILTGPAASDLITHSTSATRLANDLQRTFGAHETADARQECDLLIQSLQELNGPMMENNCCGRTSIVEWPVTTDITSHELSRLTPMPQYAPKCLALNSRYQYDSGRGSDAEAHREPQIFAIKNWFRHPIHNLTAHGRSGNLVIPTKRKLGIAPATVRIGDLICAAEGATRALVLRVSAETNSRRHVRLRAIGSGLVSEDIAGAVPGGNDREWRKSPIDCGELDLHVDAETLFMLADDFNSSG